MIYLVVKYRVLTPVKAGFDSLTHSYKGWIKHHYRALYGEQAAIDLCGGEDEDGMPNSVKYWRSSDVDPKRVWLRSYNELNKDFFTTGYVIPRKYLFFFLGKKNGNYTNFIEPNTELKFTISLSNNTPEDVVSNLKESIELASLVSGYKSRGNRGLGGLSVVKVERFQDQLDDFGLPYKSKDQELDLALNCNLKDRLNAVVEKFPDEFCYIARPIKVDKIEAAWQLFNQFVTSFVGDEDNPNIRFGRQSEITTQYQEFVNGEQKIYDCFHLKRSDHPKKKKQGNLEYKIKRHESNKIRFRLIKTDQQYFALCLWASGRLR